MSNVLAFADNINYVDLEESLENLPINNKKKTSRINDFIQPSDVNTSSYLIIEGEWKKHKTMKDFDNAIPLRIKMINEIGTDKIVYQLIIKYDALNYYPNTLTAEFDDRREGGTRRIHGFLPEYHKRSLKLVHKFFKRIRYIEEDLHFHFYA